MNNKLLKLRDWGCDIQGALSRFLDDEDFMLECIVMVSTDPAFEALGRAINEGNITNAFEAAHTLKGILANTGLTPLYEIIVQIVEPLRAGKTEGLEQKYALLLDGQQQLVRILSQC